MAGRGYGPGGGNPAVNRFAFMAGVLTTMVAASPLWWFSQWLGDQVFAPQWGYDNAQIMVVLAFCLVCGMSITLAQYGWSSSIMMQLVIIISKSPVF